MSRNTKWINAKGIETFRTKWILKWKSWETTQQLEYLSDNRIYFRGMGGGFACKVTQIDDEHVYLQKINASVPEQYRIPRSEYDRLLTKGCE
jgi:hypothetical protein